MAISLQYWATYTAGNVKLQRKSEKAVSAEHVLKFVYDAESKLVDSIVQASMRDRSYKVKVMIPF
jgi:hypothetical protein